MLTACEVRHLFRYDPKTGRLSWRISPSNNVKVGQEAGSLTKWSYRQVRVKRRDHKAHRIIWLYMTGRWPQEQIDHIDGDGLNNRWNNLREATPLQNQANRRVNHNNKLQVKGVDLYQGRYRAQIRMGGKKCFLGSFGTPEEAQTAYQEAAVRLHGDYAKRRI